VPTIHKVLFGYHPKNRFVTPLSKGLLPINENITLTDNGWLVYRIVYQMQEDFKTIGIAENNNSGFFNLNSGDGIMQESVALREVNTNISLGNEEKNIDLMLKQG
jgi:hypothetical protein